jgi:hypothetical protein
MFKLRVHHRDPLLRPRIESGAGSADAGEERGGGEL